MSMVLSLSEGATSARKGRPKERQLLQTQRCEKRKKSTKAPNEGSRNPPTFAAHPYGENLRKASASFGGAASSMSTSEMLMARLSSCHMMVTTGM